jgi:hypothetical protein
MIHDSMIMGHPGRGMWMVTAVVAAFHLGVAIALQRAHTNWAQNPGQQGAQEKHRRCESRGHYGNCISPPLDVQAK